MPAIAPAPATWPLPVAVWEHAPPKQVTSGTSPQRTILYWQDPDGKPDFSPGAKKTADGRDYVPVYEDQEADFKEAKPPAPAEKAGKRILYYRNPMGLADTSPVPKKDWMGMDYIPVYDGEQDGGNTVKVSPGRLQRTGVKTQLVGKLPIKETIKAPGVVAFDENSAVSGGNALRWLHQQGHARDQRYACQEKVNP